VRVIPWIPRALRASFTSSNLNGLSTATISFMLLVSLSYPMMSSQLPAAPVRVPVNSAPPRRLTPAAWQRWASPAMAKAPTRSTRVSGGERLLAVDGEVADLEDLIAVPGATEDQADELHEDEGDEGGPEDDPDRRSNCSHSWWAEPV